MELTGNSSILNHKKISIGKQNFEDIIKNGCFYVDKTDFVRRWWQSGSDVVAIMRPRRFGKTLNMDTVYRFFSLEFAGRGAELFGNLAVWQDEAMRQLQGTYPVIFLTFANVKGDKYDGLLSLLRDKMAKLYRKYLFLLQSDRITEEQKVYFRNVMAEANEADMKVSLNSLSEMLYMYYGQKVIILLDEYDTPLQEAYVNGYWDRAVNLFKDMFNYTFKSNDYMHRSLMTGITRVAKESIFSDLNNLDIVTMLSDKYADCFGFTEQEVFSAMNNFGLSDKSRVKEWYDGFNIGNIKDIYNPWSILGYIDNKGKLDTYWANTSSNSLVGKLIREGDSELKLQFDQLLRGNSIDVWLDENLVYNQLDDNADAIWSLLYTSGYLTGECIQSAGENEEGNIFSLHITNTETKVMFRKLVKGWFHKAGGSYNGFVKYMLQGDLKAMNVYMNRITMSIFSYFDTGKQYAEPEKFYHGFVLGLMVELRDRYDITSNRESGFGRYDVMLVPKNIEMDDAIIIEFKVHDPDECKNLADTVQAAIQQIDSMHYEASLIAQGISVEKIRKYGFAFEGKKVLIGVKEAVK